MMAPSDIHVRKFLAQSSIVQVATLSTKQHPFVTPLWFVVHGGAIYITTGYASRAGRNIQHNASVSLLFMSDRTAPCADVLHLRGHATVHRGTLPWPVLFRVAFKYELSPRALLTEVRNIGKWRLRRRYYAQGTGGGGYIRVVPATCELLQRP